MRNRTEIYHARLNLPNGNMRIINLDETDGKFFLTAYGGGEFINELFLHFNRAWERVLELQEA